MNLEQEFWVMLIIVGIVIAFTFITMQPTSKDLIVEEFPQLKSTIYESPSENECACYCVTENEHTGIYVNRAPEFIKWGAN